MGHSRQAIRAPATEAGVPALEVEGLIHDFGAIRALDDVAFANRAGDFTGLLGLNGAGKTTLYALITRLYSNRSGSIKIFGHDVRRQTSRALSLIGVVFQQPTLDLDLTIEQNLHYHAALHGLSWSEAQTRLEVELERIGLTERAHDKVRTLSGGQRRRVEIARALLHQPKLLLLDEPTVGLDVGSRHGILSHVRRLCREDGLAVLWATHLLDEVEEGDKVVVLHEGRVLATGGVPEVNRRAGARDIREAFTNLIGGLTET
jgi:ABC-2 type transport system ATP-binding protein